MKKPKPLVEIAGTGRFLPDNVVTNEDLAKSLDTSDEWIRSRTGIRERRIAPDDMGAADLGTGAVDIAVDAQENTRLFWTSARDALAGADRGEIDVIFPTRRNLERLAQFDDFGQARDHAQTTPLPTIVPWIEERPEGRSLCIPEGCGYPVTSVPLGDAKRG